MNSQKKQDDAELDMHAGLGGFRIHARGGWVRLLYIGVTVMMILLSASVGVGFVVYAWRH